MRVTAQLKAGFIDCLKACTETAELNKEDFRLHKFRFDIRDSMSMGGSGSAHRPAVSGTLRYGIDDAVSQALSQ
jgi:hypothetical protein